MAIVAALGVPNFLEPDAPPPWPKPPKLKVDSPGPLSTPTPPLPLPFLPNPEQVPNFLELDAPPPGPKPAVNRLESGMNISQPLGTSGRGTLTISNGTRYDAAALLDEETGETKTVWRFVYVRARDSITIKNISPCQCRLFFALGTDWDTPKKKFRMAKSFSLFDDRLRFTESERSAMTYSVSLHPVREGTAKTSQLSEEEFEKHKNGDAELDIPSFGPVPPQEGRQAVVNPPSLPPSEEPAASLLPPSGDKPGRDLSDNTSLAIAVPLHKQRGTFVVPVLINNTITLAFVVDSGAADVTIPSDVVKTLMRTGTLNPTDFIGEQKYVLADGSIVPSRIFRIRSMKIGNRVVENVMGSEAPEKGFLLLGQSFFDRP